MWQVAFLEDTILPPLDIHAHVRVGVGTMQFGGLEAITRHGLGQSQPEPCVFAAGLGPRRPK